MANLIFENIGPDYSRAQRMSDQNYDQYVRKFIGHVTKFELTRSNSGPDIIIASCEGFGSFLKSSINQNYPDKFDYWVSEFGGEEVSNLKPDGIDFPNTFDAWPLESAAKVLLRRGFIDDSLFHRKATFLNNADTVVTGTFLLEKSNPQVVLERARDYGAPSLTISTQKLDDEYRLKTNYGDTMFDYLNKVIEPYGWSWGIDNFRAAPYLRTRDNPTDLISSEAVTLSGTGWSNKNVELDAISGTYRETTTPDDFVEFNFTNQRIDLVSVLYNTSGTSNGGTQAIVGSGTTPFAFVPMDVLGTGFAVGNRVVFDLPTGRENMVITGTLGDSFIVDPPLSVTPVSGTLVRTAIASAEVRRGSNWSLADSISTVYVPSFYEHGLDKVIVTESTTDLDSMPIISGTKRFFHHGFDLDTATNPTKFSIATGLSRDEHIVRITRLPDAEAQANATFGFNALFLYDKDRNLPVHTFRTGDTVASGTIVDLSIKNSGEDIRNDVIVVGRRVGVEVPGGFEDNAVNPNNPVNKFITSRAVDVNSVYNKTAKNFVGRPIQTVLIEPSIGSQDRADFWAVSFMNRFRFPGKDGTFQSLANPLIEPEDCIYVDDESKDSINTSNRVWVEDISSDWDQKKALDQYDTTSFPPWQSFIPKPAIDLTDFDNKPVKNVKIANAGTPDAPYDPYSADESGTFVDITFDLNISGFLKVEVWTTHKELSTKVADLLNTSGEEGEVGWSRETLGSNKRITWDGVDIEGKWNERWLEVDTDTFDQGFSNFYVSEPRDADDNLEPFTKLYLKFFVIDFSGTAFSFDTSLFTDVPSQDLFIYTKRGEPITAEMSLLPVFMPPFRDFGGNLVPPQGFSISLFINFSRTNAVIRPSKLFLSAFHHVFGAQLQARLFVGEKTEVEIINRGEFIDYGTGTPNAIQFNPTNIGNFNFEDWDRWFEVQRSSALGGDAWIAHYFIFQMAMTDKSGRTALIRKAHWWDAPIINPPITGEPTSKQLGTAQLVLNDVNVGWPWGKKISPLE